MDADLLSNLRQSAAEGLFHSFDLLVGKDAREAGIKFEVLLGVYTNAIQYVRFLETALASTRTPSNMFASWRRHWPCPV